MSGVDKTWLRSRLRSALGPVVLATGTAMFCLTASAQNQPMNSNDTGSLLRGRVSEEEVNRTLLQRRAGSATRQRQDIIEESGASPAPAYEPFSTSDGSTPAPETMQDQPLLDDPQAAPEGNDIFGETAVATGRPTTAMQRANDRRRQLGARPESTAERRRREAADKRKAMAEETAGTVRTAPIDRQMDRRPEPAAERAQPVDGLAPRQQEEDPYTAVGIQVGTFTLRPSVEQGVTITDNVNSSANGKDAVLSETTLRLNAISDFDGERTTLNGYGNYRKSVSGEDYDYTAGGFDGGIDRMIGNDYKATAALSYAIRPESFSSPVEITGAASRPIQQTLQASASIAKDMGKLRLGATAKVDREWYGDADVVDGSGDVEVVSQEDRNSTLATVALRGGYEISPALTPFLEVEAGRRFYDVGVDEGGFERSANHTAVNAGVELDFGEKLNGELSAGYVMEDLDDRRLGTIGGLNMAARLDWSPERGTIVGLTGTTEVEGTTEANSAGSLLYSGELSIERQIRANLTANAAVGLAYRDYQSTGDDDLIMSADLGGTWWLNRYAGVTARARHETMKSSLPGRDTKTNSVFLGLRLQR